MYFLLKLGIFHCYVSLPEGSTLQFRDISNLGTTILPTPKKTWNIDGRLQFKKENTRIRHIRHFHICMHFQACMTYIYIYDPGSRFATTPPPPPPMVWSQNLRFAAFCMKALYLQCFLHGGWLALSANLQIRRVSCNQPSENVLFAMFRLRCRGVVPWHPLLCQIII